MAEEGSGLIGMVMGLGFTGLLLANVDGPGEGASHILGALALGFLYALPGALAMLGRRRPALYLAAGVVGVPLSFTSFAGVTLPLLLPSGMALVAYGRRSAGDAPRIAAPVIALHAFVLGILAFVVLLMLHEDPRCHAIENGTTCSSDIVTPPEALAGLGVTAIAITSTWALAGQKEP